MNISAKFGPNLFSGFREEDEHMKSLQTQMTTDAKWWQKLTWPFGPGELIKLPKRAQYNVFETNNQVDMTIICVSEQQEKRSQDRHHYKYS